MAKIIAITNQKGGTGKTTTSINLASYLASYGRRVLLLDLDPQGNASSGIGVTLGETDKSLYHVITDQARPHEVVKPTSLENLEIISSSQDLAAATIELVNFGQREYKLQNALNEFKNKYHYIIIDCPPSLGLLTINGLVATDEILIPVQCEYYALEGLGQLLNTISLIQENLKPELKLMGALLTMFDKRNTLSYEVAKEVKRHFPGYVFEAVIPRNVSLSEAPSYGKSIMHYDPWSKGARAYKQLAQEVIKLSNN